MPIEDSSINLDPCKTLRTTYGLYYILDGKYNLYMGAATFIQCQSEIEYSHTFRGYELLICEEERKIHPLTEDEIKNRCIQGRNDI